MALSSVDGLGAFLWLLHLKCDRIKENGKGINRMLFQYKSDELKAMPYYDYADLKGKEKDLENLLANNLSDLYIEDGQLMPIFQERQWQEEPDLLALDKDGNLIIFELKRGIVQGDTTIQVMRYAQSYGQKGYDELNRIYIEYVMKNTPGVSVHTLKEDHAEAFELESPLKEESFNLKQKLVIVGSSSDISLIQAVDYWKSKKLDIDFLPYRFYKIGGEIYFDFFAKPYDYHINSRDKKGILFDTNYSCNKDSVWDMFENSKISAYGKASRFIYSFNKGDYVLYFHKGWGVIGAGVIKTSTVWEDKDKDELYHTVDLLTPTIKNESDICNISSAELCQMLDKNFYFANTTKRPYLTVKESELVIEELKKKYK